MREMELLQKLLDLEVSYAELTKKVDNLELRVAEMESGYNGSGVFLDGVPEIYRKEVEFQSKGQQKG